MSKLYMLDTNMVSYILKGKSAKARARLEGLEGIACVSSITVGEIEYGLARSANSARLRTAAGAFLAHMEVLPWDGEAAEAYGLLRAKLEAAGRPLAALDMLIAAHAVAVDAVLVTHDKVFQYVKDLRGREDWATDV